MGCFVSKNDLDNSNDIKLYERRRQFDYKFSLNDENILEFLGYFPELPLENITIENVACDREHDYLGSDTDCKYIALFFTETKSDGGDIIFSANNYGKKLHVVPENKTGIIFDSNDHYRMTTIKKGIVRYVKVKIF